MGQTVNVYVESSSIRFWNYVYADARLMGKRVSSAWANAAMSIDSASADEKLMCEGLEHEIGQDRAYAYLSGEVWYSSRAWGTGWSKEYYLDASRACPEAEILIYELLILGQDQQIEWTHLKDGRVIGHYVLKRKTDEECFADRIYEVFSIDIADLPPLEA